MAKYKGSVELIAGITQKNKEAGNNFALVDAADVQVDDSGKRLNERLDELAAGIGTGNGAPVELSNYYNRTEADKKFATAEALKSYYTKTEADTKFETKGALSYYYTKTQAEEKFAKKTDVEGFAKTSDLESLSSALGTLSDDYEYLNSRHASTAAKLQIAENTVADHETRLHNLERVQGTGGQEFDLSDYYTKDEADEKYASRDEIDNLLAGGADLTQYAKIETVEDHEARISELEALGGVTFDTAEFEDLSTDDKTIIGAINEIATDAYLSFSKSTKNECEIGNIKNGSVEVGRAKAATNDAKGRAIHETYATKDELDAVVSGGADLMQYTKTADFLNGKVEVQRAQRATYDAEGNLIHGTYTTHTDLAEAVAEAVEGLPQLSQDVEALKGSSQANAESIENHEERIKTLEEDRVVAVDFYRGLVNVRANISPFKQVIAKFQMDGLFEMPAAEFTASVFYDLLEAGAVHFLSGYVAENDANGKWTFTPLVSVWVATDNWGQYAYVYFGYAGETASNDISAYLYPPYVSSHTGSLVVSLTQSSDHTGNR